MGETSAAVQTGQKKKGLNSNILKTIAIIAMTIDHLAWVLAPGDGHVWYLYVLHSIGRITAPIMCFFIAEGFHYTRNVKKYAGRLLFFALISHFAYNFAFGIPFLPCSTGDILDQTSVIWALFWGLMALAIAGPQNIKLPQWAKVLAVIGICVISFPANWSCVAVLVILNFGSNRGNFKKQMIGLPIFVAVYALVYGIFADWQYGLVQMMVILAIPLLKLYNGERGAWKGMKWFFYLYYPFHLFVCGIIRCMLAR